MQKMRKGKERKGGECNVHLGKFVSVVRLIAAPIAIIIIPLVAMELLLHAWNGDELEVFQLGRSRARQNCQTPPPTHTLTHAS